MLEKLREKRNEESGFTLVELLVVMLILGILAAIAVPAFFSQRDKAQDADAKSGVRTAQTAIETYATDNGGDYTGATVADLEDIEPTLADTDLSEPSGLSETTYTVTGTSEHRQHVLDRACRRYHHAGVHHLGRGRLPELRFLGRRLSLLPPCPQGQRCCEGRASGPALRRSLPGRRARLAAASAPRYRCR